jgi:predicted dehydrogenase
MPYTADQGSPGSSAAQCAPIRWGIVGCGHIAARFAEGLAHVDGATLLSAWSRRAESANAFVHAHGGSACSSFDELLRGAAQAIYIATLPDSHADYAIAALRAGKHVLCEKPAAVSGAELERVLAVADASGCLFMEAMKPPFYPLYRRLRAQLENDPIGPIGLVRAGCSLSDVRADHASLRLDLAGGALLGIGIYEAFLAVDWLGAATDVHTLGRLGPTGVDTFVSMHCQHERGIAQLYCGLDLAGKGDALLAGSHGHVTIHENWWNPVRATVHYPGGRSVDLHEPFAGGGLNYETAHFCDLIRAGQRQSPLMTHATSRRMIAILDRARAALGLRYPFER